MREKKQVELSTSKVEFYMTLSLKKHNSLISDEANTTDKKGKINSPESLEADTKKIAEIKATTGLVFPDNALNHTVYDELLPMFEEAAKIEQSSLDETARTKHAMRNTTIVAVLFNSSKEALAYLKNYEQGYSGNQLLHDACLITLPEKDQWNVRVWKALIQKYIHEPKLFRIFQNAIAIEAYIVSKRHELEEENSQKIDARYVTLYGKQFEELQNKKLKETQIKETQKDFKIYLQEQLVFPKQKKATEEQKNALKHRLNNPTEQDQAYREQLIQQYLTVLLAKYEGVDISTKEQFIKTMLNNNKVQINATKINENKALFSKNTSYEQLKSYLNFIIYKNYDKNISAAELFTDLAIPEKYFDEYLLMNPHDNSSYIPEVHIDGEALGHKNFVLKKLNPADPRAALLGKFTSCCQSLTDEGAACVKYGIMSERSGFYVLSTIDPTTKNERIVAQCWAWRGKNNSIVFDSVESNFNFRNKEGALALITEFYAYLADKLVREKEVPNVMVGFGGDTPDSLKVIPSPHLHVAHPIDYAGYRDSKKQGFLAIQGTSLYSLFSDKKIKSTPEDNAHIIVSEPTSLALMAKNKLIYVISKLDINKFNDCGLTSELVQAWNIEKKNIIKSLKSDNRETVLEAFRRYKQHIGFDDITDMNELDDELASQIESEDSFDDEGFSDDDDDFSLDSLIRIILSDEKNKSLINSLAGLKSINPFINNMANFIKEVLGDKQLQYLINSADDLASLFESVSPDEQFNLIKEVLGTEKFQSIINYRADLESLLRNATHHEQFNIIMGVLGAEKFYSIINSLEELGWLLFNIPENKRLYFLKEVVGYEKLKSMMHSIQDMYNLLTNIDYYSREHFAKELLGDTTLLLLVNSPNDLNRVLHAINHNDEDNFIKKTIGETKLHLLINSLSDLNLLLEGLWETWKIDLTLGLFGVVKIRSLISSVIDLNSLLSEVHIIARKNIIEKVIGREKLQSIITSVSDLNILLSNFADYDRLDFITRILGVNKLLLIITSLDDVKSLYSNLREYEHYFIRGLLSNLIPQLPIHSLNGLEFLQSINFDKHLSIFIDKAKQMKRRSAYDPYYVRAAKTAKELCDNLIRAKTDFLSQNVVMEQLKFKVLCKTHIKEARTQLDQHRGWSGAIAKFLADLVAWFSSTLANKLGFFGKTDSSIKLEQFEMDLKVTQAK